MTPPVSPLIERRRAYLRGPALRLFRRLTHQDRVNLGVYTDRDGRRACLLGHLALTPPLQADGWRFINGVPCWAGYMGVRAAQAYFGLEWQQALDLFGNQSESCAASLAERLSLLDNMLQCNIDRSEAIPLLA